MAIKIADLFEGEIFNLGTLSTDATSQLDVLGHDSDTLGMDSTQVGILEETNQVCLGSFLKSLDGGSLESQISLEILSNLTDKSLEGQLSDEELCGFLVSSDLTESNGSWSISVGLLHSSSGWGRFSGSLGGQLLPWSLSSGGFSCSLLGTSHGDSSDETEVGAMCCYIY